MKSLADQLREQMENSGGKRAGLKKGESKVAPPVKPKKTTFPVLEQMIAFDNGTNKTLVHSRFDSKTADLMNKFKMATNVDVTKFVVFAVKEFFENHPELKTIIKQYIQNTDL